MTLAGGPVLMVALTVPPGRRRAARAAVLQVANPPRAEAFELPPDDTGAGFTGRRYARRVRSRGATLEVAWLEGRLHAEGGSWPWARVELRWLAGPRVALALLAARWQKRLDLLADPFSLAFHAQHGRAVPAPARRSRGVVLSEGMSAAAALATLAEECLAQVVENAAAIAFALPGSDIERVHQLRVGVRRLRSVLRLFRGWAEAPPDARVTELKDLFRVLGEGRDAAVLEGGIAAELAAAGAPPLQAREGAIPAEPGAWLRRGPSHQLLLGWQAWVHGLDDTLAIVTAAADSAWSRRAAKRLTRWHERLAATAGSFDSLDDEALHSLRKDVKRQRYLVELLAPLWGRRATARYLRRLAALQEGLGAITDLLTARSRYQALVEQDPAAWFALGWLAARLAESRQAIRETLRRFIEARLPWA